jgi:hypothetical protein
VKKDLEARAEKVLLEAMKRGIKQPTTIIKEEEVSLGEP